MNCQGRHGVENPLFYYSVGPKKLTGSLFYITINLYLPIEYFLPVKGSNGLSITQIEQLIKYDHGNELSTS